MPGPYVYMNALELVGKPLVGSHECVALVQAYTAAPSHGAWREGLRVRGNLHIVVGTAIATFVDGRYPNHSHGNHAAFYVGQDATGIFVVEQYSHIKDGKIAKRHIRFRGGVGSRSNDGDAYSVIQ